jgi:hypothetical protein
MISRWLASSLAEYRKHPGSALVMLIVLFAAIVAAGTKYVATHGGGPPVHTVPGTSQSASPDPTSTNTGFQTGDNDAPTTAPSSFLTPAPSVPSPGYVPPPARDLPGRLRPRPG